MTNQPLTKDDFIYYDAESDSVYFGRASDSEIVQYEEHLFFTDKVQSAVEGIRKEIAEHIGEAISYELTSAWFPVFVDNDGWLDVSKHVKGYENTLTSLAGKDSLSRPSKTSPKIEGQLQHGVNTGELKTCEDCDSIKDSPQKKNAPCKGDLFDDEFKEWFDNEIERKKDLFRKGICPTCGGEYAEYKTSHSHSSCGAKVSSNAATEDEYHSDKESPLVNVGAATVSVANTEGTQDSAVKSCEQHSEGASPSPSTSQSTSNGESRNNLGESTDCSATHLEVKRLQEDKPLGSSEETAAETPLVCKECAKNWAVTHWDGKCACVCHNKKGVR